MSFRTFRIIVLLCLLVLTGGSTYCEQWMVSQWTQPLRVMIYPINGDGSDAVQTYIDGLTSERFQDIAAFMDRQSERYLVKRVPSASINLGRQVQAFPPVQPTGASGVVSNVLWSLKLRYYVFRNTPFFDSFGKIRLFVVYHEGDEGRVLQHSLGLQKGLLGVVHAYALRKQDAQNNVVITHEMLHTLGATDKYDSNLQPIFPEGFGDAERNPRYPQSVAEIMAGRLAISNIQATIPENLDQCVIGYKTAHEIKW